MKTKYIVLFLIFYLAGCGSKASSSWSYHTSDYTNGTNLSDVSAPTAKIGDVHLTKFSDGTAWFSSSGVVVDVTGDSQSFSFDFGHSSYLKNADGNIVLTYKLDSYGKMVIRYSINHHSDPPTFSATVDTDGKYDNNKDTAFTLSQD